MPATKPCLRYQQAVSQVRTCTPCFWLISAVISCHLELGEILEILSFRLLVWKIRKVEIWWLNNHLWQSQAWNQASGMRSRLLPGPTLLLSSLCPWVSYVTWVFYLLISVCDDFIFLKLLIQSNSLGLNFHSSKEDVFYRNRSNPGPRIVLLVIF